MIVMLQHLRFKPDFLQGNNLIGDFVAGLVNDAVRTLADFLDAMEVLHVVESSLITKLRPLQPY